MKLIFLTTILISIVTTWPCVNAKKTAAEIEKAISAAKLLAEIIFFSKNTQNVWREIDIKIQEEIDKKMEEKIEEEIQKKLPGKLEMELRHYGQFAHKYRHKAEGMVRARIRDRYKIPQWEKEEIAAESKRKIEGENCFEESIKNSIKNHLRLVHECMDERKLKVERRTAGIDEHLDCAVQMRYLFADFGESDLIGFLDFLIREFKMHCGEMEQNNENACLLAQKLILEPAKQKEMEVIERISHHLVTEEQFKHSEETRKFLENLIAELADWSNEAKNGSENAFPIQRELKCKINLLGIHYNLLDGRKIVGEFYKQTYGKIIELLIEGEVEDILKGENFDKNNGNLKGNAEEIKQEQFLLFFIKRLLSYANQLNFAIPLRGQYVPILE